MEDASENGRRTRIESVSLAVAVLMVAMLFSFFVFNVYAAVALTDTAYFRDVLRPHLAAFLMLPQAAAVSYAIGVFLRQTEGPFEFSMLGVTAKGASGQVVMWVFAFLSMVVALRLVW